MIDFYGVILLYYTKEKEIEREEEGGKQEMNIKDHQEVAASTRSVYLFELMVLKDNNSKYT